MCGLFAWSVVGGVCVLVSVCVSVHVPTRAQEEEMGVFRIYSSRSNSSFAVYRAL